MSNESVKKWRLKHIEESRKQSLEYYYKHLKECQERSRKYMRDHKKALRKKQKIWSLKNYIRPIYYDIKRRCKKKNIPLNMTLSEFLMWYTIQEKTCVYCGISEDRWSDSGDSLAKFYYRLQVDRSDNKKGYSIDNIVLACPRCNFTKSDFFTSKQMLIIGAIIHANQ